jgi:hypothetical protein
MLYGHDSPFCLRNFLAICPLLYLSCLAPNVSRYRPTKNARETIQEDEGQYDFGQI